MTKEEAIKRIKDWNLDDDDMEVLVAAIPELKESEDDEQIRKELIQFLIDYPNLPNGKYCIADFFNWLEKQGEQKMKTEPKDVIDVPLIDIPFGAKDSELIGATYFIPKGFHAEIEDDKVIFKKGEQKPA